MLNKKININFKSIRVRLFLTLSIAIAGVILVLVITNSMILKTFYTYSKAFNMKKIYDEINQLYNEIDVTPANEITKLSVKNNAEITIETENNIIIYETSQDFADEINMNKNVIYKSSKDSKRFIYGQNNILINVISVNGLDYILLSGVLDNGYLMYIQVPIAAIEESVKISNNLLIIMGVIIAIISAIIASIISKKFTSPILQLNNIANRMSKLDFSKKYKITDANDEIDRLGENINKMSDTLERTIKQLRNNNNQLEKDIEKKSKIDEMRKQFISDVSHELKTPIALIQGYAEGLVENVNTDEDSKKYYAEVILDESNKMDKLVKQLLELMKIEYGKREFNNEIFDVCELINEVIRKCNVMAQEKNALIEFKNSEKINVYADEFYIEQAFTNYITNAIKNVKEVNGKRKIIIRTEMNKEKETVRIYVFNTGDKISEENLDRIWGRFYKVDESRNRADGGSGIGLSLVKAIMTSYKKEYGATNKDNGVEFYFDIQLAK